MVHLHIYLPYCLLDSPLPFFWGSWVRWLRRQNGVFFSLSPLSTSLCPIYMTEASLSAISSYLLLCNMIMSNSACTAGKGLGREAVSGWFILKV